MQAIEGLIFLHEQKIVHLDIKPGNMLISKRLKLMLSDFGEALSIEEDDPVTHQHAYTIPYCAP
jgi:serine/threonine protein kinase